MTMNTRVHIAKPVNPETLFLHILGILEADPSFTPAWVRNDPANPFKPEPGPLSLGNATYKHVRKGDVMRLHAQTGEPILERDSEYRTTLGQGLACIWKVTYGSDGPIHWGDEDDEPPDEASLPVHLVSANFDTAYGYRASNGAGCDDLHAFLLREIALHLGSVGCEEWVWLHEERGFWHAPIEIGLRGNADLIAAHFGRKPEEA